MKDACGRQLSVRNKKYTSWCISTIIKCNLLRLNKIKKKCIDSSEESVVRSLIFRSFKDAA